MVSTLTYFLRVKIVVVFFEHLYVAKKGFYNFYKNINIPSISSSVKQLEPIVAQVEVT